MPGPDLGRNPPPGRVEVERKEKQKFFPQQARTQVGDFQVGTHFGFFLVFCHALFPTWFCSILGLVLLISGLFLLILGLVLLDCRHFLFNSAPFFLLILDLVLLDY